MFIWFIIIIAKHRLPILSLLPDINLYFSKQVRDWSVTERVYLDRTQFNPKTSSCGSPLESLWLSCLASCLPLSASKALWIVSVLESSRLRPLKLQEQGRILHFYQVIDIFESCLHELNLWFDSVVAVCDRCAHYFLRTCQELAWKEFNEFVLDVLDEVKLGHALVIHDKHC